VALVFSAVVAQAAEPWKADLAIDPKTLDEVSAAVSGNDDGYRLFLYRDQVEDRILGVFALPTADADFLDTSRPPVLTVDDGPAQQLVRLSGELKSVGFLVWGGPGAPLRGTLRDLMNGSSVVVQYPLYGGGYKETSFALLGAKQTIAEVLSIPLEVDPAAQALAAEKEKALEACFAVEKKKPRQRCINRLGECGSTALSSAAEFRSCLDTK
jgi:hypothetical protein